MNVSRREHFELVSGDVLKYRSIDLVVDAKVHQHVIITFEFIVDDLDCSYE